jgi:hypothetical protein
VFHHDGCDIHRRLGHEALPTACQHFPREVLIDSRGVFVTLSHYCPTAADLLFAHDGPVEIVAGPPALRRGEPEGLDARDVLPPLLTETVLMDLEGYSAWEAHMVRVLTAEPGVAEEAVARLEADLAEVQRWRPGGRSLSSTIAALRKSGGRAGAIGNPGEAAEEVVIRRYLAARAFASWEAYQGGGIARVLESLHTVLATLREHRRRLALKEAIRQTDLEFVHLAPRRI